MLPLLLCLLIASVPQQPDCADVASCRQAALEAASRGDFEASHDLAWRAAQKGRPNDPELMVLVARAQSLSGRPGDAIVMLRRLAQMGVAVDASGDDFRRVRALPAWPEVEALLKGGSVSRTAGAEPPAPERPEAALTGSGNAPVTGDDELPEAVASIQPVGLAYDSVSRRFIVGDRRENKLVVFDDVFKRATNMVGAISAGFFALAAIEIDRRRGDLWIANSGGGRRPALHKLQLVSGRVLFELPLPPELGPATVVDAAVLDGGGVLLLDAEGRRLVTFSPGARSFTRAAALDVEGATSVASNGGSIAYVAHRAGVLRVDLAAQAATPVRGAPSRLLRIRANGVGLVGVQPEGTGHRIVRLRLDGGGRKVARVSVLDADAAMPDPSAITVAEGVLYYLTSVNGRAVLRRVRLRT